MSQAHPLNGASPAQEPKGCLGALLALVGFGNPQKQATLRDSSQTVGLEAADSSAPLEYPYVQRHDFVSEAERNFYRVLRTVVTDETVILLKVGLADLFFVPNSDRRDARTYMNKIDRKHVDFVLCDAGSVTPRVAIELDDSSHARADRQVRDELVNGVFDAAGLPLLRVPVQSGYARADLAARLQPYVQTVTAGGVTPTATHTPMNTPAAAAGAAPASAPICPHCGREMVLRTSRSGPNQGQSFWGCPNYPRCKTMLAVAPGQT